MSCPVERLEFHGIRTGRYNLPDWPGNPDGLCQKLDSMFRHTPPTALIVDDQSKGDISGWKRSGTGSGKSPMLALAAFAVAQAAA